MMAYVITNFEIENDKWEIKVNLDIFSWQINIPFSPWVVKNDSSI